MRTSDFPHTLYDSGAKKRRIFGLVLLTALLTLFLIFNRVPKLDTVQADLAVATSPVAECFQGFCIEEAPESSLLSRWWDFSVTYLRLVAAGMTFAFLVAGATEAFLFPKSAGWGLSATGIKGSLKGLLVGPAMNLCSACIVPVASAFRRRGSGVETTLAITQGSSTLNLPAIIMAAMVFAPLIGGSRIGVSLVGALLIGPLVARVVRGEDEASVGSPLDAGPSPPDLLGWREALGEGCREWAKITASHVIRLAPVMLFAGFASGLAIQWLSPQTVTTWLGDDVLGILIASTLGIAINVPLLFEIPLVAVLLLAGMGTAPAAALLFTAAAGGPITFWGLSKVMPKRAIATFGASIWVLGAAGGLVVLAFVSLGSGPDFALRADYSTATQTEGAAPHPAATAYGPDAYKTTSDAGARVNAVRVTDEGTADDADVWTTSEGEVASGTDTGDVAVNRSAVEGERPNAASAPTQGKTEPSPTSGTPVVPEGLVTIFTEVGRTAQVDFTHYRRSSDVMSLGAGVVVLDYDGDGHQDIYVPMAHDDQSPCNDASYDCGPRSNALYRNEGDGTFAQSANEARVSDPEGIGNGGCAADFDNDGHQDLFLTNWGSSKLFHNSGDGAFTDVTDAAGVGDPDDTYRSTGCSWGDYDRDGYVDLVVVRHMHEDDQSRTGGPLSSTALRAMSLHHNGGDGSFSNVTHLLGDDSEPGVLTFGSRRNSDKTAGNVWGAGFQPGWADFNNDGYPDLYVVNDFGRLVQPNVLWRNDGEGDDGMWMFTDISSESGADAAMFGMGLAVGDYNLDGHLDMFITNIGRPVLLANRREGLSFTDMTLEAGVDIGSFKGYDCLLEERRRLDSCSGKRVTWGAVFFDYDNDGDEDLYVASGFLDVDPTSNPKKQPNVLLQNDGDGSFTDVSEISGADDPGHSHGTVYLDYNNDGCLDLYVANLGTSAVLAQHGKLFENRCDWGNSWLVIRTVGTASNRDGIGARITVVAGEKTQIREVSAGGSNKSQSMLPAHFGLGKAKMVDSIQVRWPSGTVQTLRDVAVNQHITVEEAP